MSTRLRLAIFFAGMVFCLALATETRANNYVVDRADDPSGGFVCSDAVPNDCPFRSAVIFATHGDTVHFAANMLGAVITLNERINLNFAVGGTGPALINGPSTNPVTIRFPGGTIFNVVDSTPRVFTNLRFADSVGVVTYTNAFNAITLSQAQISNVQTPVNTFSNSSFNLINSTVSNSGNIINGGSIFISGVSFTGGPNRALISNGTAQIVGSTFSNYHMPDPGGAIHATGTLTVTGSNFSNNSSALGGAIYTMPGAIVQIDGGTYSGNQAVNGGGICLDQANAKVANALFTGNIAGESGGGVVAGGIIQLLNVTISGNFAAQNGAGLWLFGGSGPYLRHLTIYNNSAGNAFGGIYVTGTSPNLGNSIVAGNKAPANPDTTVVGSSNLIGGDPKLAPLNNYGGVSSINPPLCGSPAIDAGNAGLTGDLVGSPILTDQRGAGFDRNANGTVDIGAVEMVYGTVTNVLDGAADAGSLRKSIADAAEFSRICFDPSYFNVPRTISLNGTNLDIPRPMLIDGPTAAQLTIDAHLASRNIRIDSFARPVYLQNMTLLNGKANVTDAGNSNGASLLVDGFDSSAGGGAMVGTNLIVNGGSGIAGVYNKGTLTLSDSTINGFTGTGFTNEFLKTATLNRVTVTNNTAVQGAGIANGGTLTVNDSTIRFNIAAHPSGQSGSAPYGGGIANYNSAFLYLRRSLIANNSAQLGGGLYNFGYAELRNITLTGNSALQTGNGPTADGGAIYADGNYVGTSMATIDIINSTIAGNSAVNAGGGTFMKQIPGSFAVMNFVNSIEAGNTAPSGPNVSGELISYGYNLIGNNSGLSWAGNSPSLVGNIVGTAGSPVDPKFAPFGDYGGPTQMLVLLPNSPAINAANPSFFDALDQRSSPRPIGGRADIGAYEQTISIDQATLINGVRNLPYLNGAGAQLTATRQSNFAAKGESQPDAVMAPTQFTVAPFGGSLPPGLTLSPTGLLSGTPTTAGSFTFAIKATDTDGQSGVRQYTMQIFVPTAAGVSLSGQVTNSAGQALRGVTVILAAPDGSTRTTLSSSFGYYQFNDVESGRNYVVSAATKRYQFEPMVITASGNLAGLNLVAQAPMQ